ncbi:hypothetical protein CU669_16950 [Paramagnetospirillum kuznetsovii]|uniref:HTH DNA binding domain-containing protein n=1 Tax=Paramagnetospirillum kuznetsovii TaxID=2053833 RepID=A0A364NUL4_9PROT|nr:hypothetical protein [Paramagnetospirillum kuznetsovii]RAU20768.1 hypothetical protein CU669_16950 [Paramagnetospirillum kuznetsovii]
MRLLCKTTLNPIVAAHISLGRLVQFLDVDTHDLWLPDALRREAIATLKLDSQLVHGEDLAIAQLQQSRVIRPDLRAALSVIQTAERLLHGRTTGDEFGDYTSDDRLKPKRLDALMASELEPRGFDWNQDEDEIEPLADNDPLCDLLDDEDEAEPPCPALPILPPPLSTAWLTLAWTGLEGTPSSVEASVLEQAAHVIDQALQLPGLEGVSQAIWELHRPGFWPESEAFSYDGIKAEDRAFGEKLEMAHAEALPPSPGLRLVRLITPWMIQRACGIDRVMPLVSGWFCGNEAYRQIAHTTARAWTREFCGLMVAGCAAEMRRVEEIHAVLALWQRQLRSERRTADKMMERLRLLVKTPAMSSGSLARQAGMSRRMAQITLDIWCRAGVVREVTGRYAERVWLADRLA